MARTEKVIMTNMCMVFSENRVLVQDKRDDDYSGITFPGGHVERGESFTDGVFHGYDELDNERIDLDFCWVRLEELKKGTKVYPLELMPYILESG